MGEGLGAHTALGKGKNFNTKRLFQSKAVSALPPRGTSRRNGAQSQAYLCSMNSHELWLLDSRFFSDKLLFP